MLSIGSSGDEVTVVQKKLKDLGLYFSDVDGLYGKGTHKAVSAFQSQYFVNGVVDSYTAEAIEVATIGHEYSSPPHGLEEIEQVYGRIEFTDGNSRWGEGLGWITITNNWRDDFLLKEDLPIVGKHFVNRNVVGSLCSALTELKEVGLEKDIRQFACWAPRHQLHNPRHPLSMHSWAAAVDINWFDNGLGKGHGRLDPRIVKAFESRGWTWGGRWRNSDPMHFQLATGH